MGDPSDSNYLGNVNGLASFKVQLRNIGYANLNGRTKKQEKHAEEMHAAKKAETKKLANEKAELQAKEETMRSDELAQLNLQYYR